MDRYLLIPFLVGWTSIYQLFWGSLRTRVLTHPHMYNYMYVCIIICMICGWNQLTVWDHSPDCFSLSPWRLVWNPTVMRRCHWSEVDEAVLSADFCGLQYLRFVNFQDLQNNHNHSVGSSTARARYNSWQLTRTRRILRVSAVGHRGRVVTSSFFDRSYAKYGDWCCPLSTGFAANWSAVVSSCAGQPGWARMAT